MAPKAEEIEIFLRNALRQKRTEDSVIKQIIADLRSTLLAAQRTIEGSGILAPGPGRDRQITQLVSAVASSIQRTWGIPTLARLQEAMVPWFEGQLAFARRLVRAAGGQLTAEGAVNASPTVVANAVNQAVVNGKTLSTTLTQAMPALMADRMERIIRLGLQDAAGQVAAVYQDAVVVTTERNVEAIIRTGVHEVGSVAQQMIYELEADPAWMEQNGLVWTAVLDSDVCPICIGLDGKQYKQGEPAPYFDGRNKISPHLNCRCYLIPQSWRDNEERIVEGDRGEARQTFKQAASQWVQDNPETARSIFGVKLGNQLIEGKISFNKAIKQWQAPKRKAT